MSLVLIILYCLKTYSIYLTFNFLALEETDSLLFTFVLKKPYFSIFHKNYLINISPYLRALGQFRMSVRKQAKIMCMYVIFIIFL